MIRTELIRPIGALLRAQAASRGAAPAYADRQRCVTYGALAARTGNLAGHLQTLGLAPGDAVALLLPNSVDWIEACLAVARAGGVIVPISHESTADEIAYRLADAGCQMLMSGTARAAEVAHLAGPDCRLIVAGEAGAQSLEALLAAPAAAPPRDPDAMHEPRFIVYTSGTTGQAKGVVLTEHSLLWVTAACWAPIVGLRATDRVLSPLPLFHSYALSFSVLSILATGASEYILERFSTRQVLSLIEGGGFTVLPGVPTIFHYLLDASRGAGTPAVGGLRLCVSAGAIMPGDLNAAFEAQFGTMLLDGYGITETSTMVTMNWPTGNWPTGNWPTGGRVMGSCGLPLPGLAVRLLDPTTGKDAAPGEAGELVVRGPNVMLGYHGKPEATASALREGWYHTGDLARCDTNGFVTITGRLKELIIRGGQNIAPAEIEAVVSAYAPVLDCAVVGAPDAYLGEVPVVFIVARDGGSIDPAALAAHCARHLSAYKVPHAVHPVPEIPRTGSGKVMRFKLRALL